MVHNMEGALRVEGGRVAIVVSRYHGFITESLLKGAITTLERHGIATDDIQVLRVPGAFELPVAAARVAAKGVVDGIICLGALIRGDTPHFDYISAEVTRGIGTLAMDRLLPIGFGLLTCNTVEQAVERAGDDAGNKGSEAAAAALEMIDLFRQIGEEG